MAMIPSRLPALRLLVALILALPVLPATEGTVSRELVVGGVTRTYRLHVPPSYASGTPVPLVLAFHYLGGSGALMESLTGFSPLADQRGFIVAYPDGVRGQFDIGAPGYAVDDLGFVDALVASLAGEYAIAPGRIYATGMSNGGYFTHLLGLERPTRFAAIAPVAGGMLSDHPAAGGPVPVLTIRGTADPVVAYEGGTGQLGAEAITAFWVATDGCSPTPEIVAMPDADPADGCTASRARYAGGTGGSEVVAYTVSGGGHAWPGHDLPKEFGPSCKDFDATAEIWAFFASYPRSSGGTTGTSTGSSTAGTTGSTTGGGGGSGGGCGLGSASTLVGVALALAANRPRRRRIQA
jgi:polyhydroxybutyrate depolymerase